MTSTPLSSATILVGVTGSIAAYKAPLLVRELRRLGAVVHVVLTEHAAQFVTPLTLQTLSGNRVLTTLFDAQFEHEIGHIALARAATHVLVAPATAHSIAKAAHGLCDDLLTTIICATTAPVVFAPAMNVQMWYNTITQRNVHTLREVGYTMIDPTAGELACGEEGLGRMADIDTIIAALVP